MIITIERDMTHSTKMTLKACPTSIWCYRNLILVCDFHNSTDFLCRMWAHYDGMRTTRMITCFREAITLKNLRFLKIFYYEYDKPHLRIYNSSNNRSIIYSFREKDL